MSEQLLIKAFKAFEDLKKHRAIALTSDGMVKLASTDSDKAIGIALAGGNSSKDNFADILLIGICDAIAGGAFAVGDALTWDSESRLVKATANKKVIATALEASAAADNITRVLLRG